MYEYDVTKDDQPTGNTVRASTLERAYEVAVATHGLGVGAQLTHNQLDPEPDSPYGTCKLCGQSVAGPPGATEHLTKTCPKLGAGLERPVISVTNRTRAQRVEAEIEDLVSGQVESGNAIFDISAGTFELTESASEEIVYDISALIDAGLLTADEATGALPSDYQLKAVWQNFLDNPEEWT